MDVSRFDLLLFSVERVNSWPSVPPSWSHWTTFKYMTQSTEGTSERFVLMLTDIHLELEPFVSVALFGYETRWRRIYGQRVDRIKPFDCVLPPTLLAHHVLYWSNCRGHKPLPTFILANQCLYPAVDYPADIKKKNAFVPLSNLPVLLDVSNSIFEVAQSLGWISPVRKIRNENEWQNPRKRCSFCFSPSFCIWCSSTLIFMIPICSLGLFPRAEICDPAWFKCTTLFY